MEETQKKDVLIKNGNNTENDHNSKKKIKKKILVNSKNIIRINNISTRFAHFFIIFSQNHSLKK